MECYAGRRPAAGPSSELPSLRFEKLDFAQLAKCARSQSKLLYLLNRNEKNVTYHISHIYSNIVLRDCSAHRGY